MEAQDIIIIGAGAAGLMAARELAKAGKKTILLEARDRIGGRIHTITRGNNEPLELGAEFIHGDLPLTISLLKEAGIPFHKAEGSWWQHRNGKLQQSQDIIPDWDTLITKLKSLPEDTPLQDFVERYLKEEKYASLRNSVLRFATGYDTADPRDASCFALREEWLTEEDAPQYRIDKGYSSLMEFLLKDYQQFGGQLFLNTVVKTVHWQTDSVTLITTDNRQYTAKKAIITLPLNVLCAAPGVEGGIRFSPAIPAYSSAFEKMGMGAIIKLQLCFEHTFWEQHPDYGQQLQDLQFILSEEPIPTWWTQYPHQDHVLTGWLGGPEAKNAQHKNADQLKQLALASLSTIFNTDIEFLKAILTHVHITNWTTDPYTRGSYSYATVATDAAMKMLQQPVAGTLFFAGEAFYKGPLIGTVEAALISGQAIVKRIL